MAQFSSVKDKKSPNFELNLVPVIDLMCVCITFLLITAVWTQLSMVKLGTSVLGQAADVSPDQLPPNYKPFRVDIKDEGYVLTYGTDVLKVPKVDGKYDKKGFRAHLAQIKAESAQKNDAVISMGDHLPYQLLIAGMDSLIAAGFKDVGIAVGEVR
jgi:biopolymer transport protein TolR